MSSASLINTAIAHMHWPNLVLVLSSDHLCLQITVPGLEVTYSLRSCYIVVQADINKLADDFEEQLKASREKLEVFFVNSCNTDFLLGCKCLHV